MVELEDYTPETYERPYCEAQAMGMLCGRPVEKWDYQCKYHDPEGETRKDSNG